MVSGYYGKPSQNTLAAVSLLESYLLQSKKEWQPGLATLGLNPCGGVRIPARRLQCIQNGTIKFFALLSSNVGDPDVTNQITQKLINKPQFILKLVQGKCPCVWYFVRYCMLFPISYSTQKKFEYR